MVEARQALDRGRLIVRFENSICRYDEDTVIRCVFVLVGFPSPPLGKGRVCLEELLKPGGAFERMSAVPPQRERPPMKDLLLILSAPRIEPTVEQICSDRQVERTLFFMGTRPKVGVAIHAGIGAIFYRGEIDRLISEVAPITGAGMEKRRDYLCSVIEATRDTLEQTFS